MKANWHEIDRTSHSSNLSSSTNLHFQEPISNVKFRYLQISTRVCHPKSLQSHNADLVVVVKSGVGNVKRRNMFRQFYASGTSISGLNFALVFSIGIPRFRDKNNDQQQESDLNEGEYFSKETYEKAMMDLVEEMETHDDLVVGDFEDSYFNLSMKTQFSFIWAATFCRDSRPTLLFADDDVPFSLENIARVIQFLNVSQRESLLHGVLINRNNVTRHKMSYRRRWFMTKSEVPFPVYPPYLHGGYRLIGFQQLEQLTLGMLFTKRFLVEDA